MIRLTFFLRRKAGTSVTEFQQYWREQHGPLVASVGHDLNILRYVQTHTLDTPGNEAAQNARGNMEPHYDGVADLWWSTEAELEAATASEAGKRASALLLDDEAKFIDLEQSPLYFSYEYPQVNPSPENIVAAERSGIVRVVFPLRHQESIAEAGARHYWLTQHGPIVRRGAPATGMLCYRQVHRANYAMDADIQKVRGTKVPSYLGIAEAWVDQGTAPDTEEARRANASFIEDEHNFIDMERSTIFFGKEHVFIDKRHQW